jgi:hypothetical protein
VSVRTRWLAWVAIASTEEPAGSLAGLRIATGLVLLTTLLSMLPSGTIDAAWVLPDEGGFRLSSALPWLFRALGGASKAAVHGVFWTGVAGSALVTVGLGGRLVALATLQVAIALFGLDRSSGGGHDHLITNALWLLVLGRSTETLSLDCLLRTGRLRSDRPVWAAPRWLAMAQLCALYFTAGIHKLGVEWTPWGGFSALYYVLQAPHLQRIDMTWLGWVYPVTQVATAVTMVFEIGVPPWLAWFILRGKATAAAPREGVAPEAPATATTPTTPTRPSGALTARDPRLWLAGVGLLLHGGIFLAMDLGPFSAITLAYYPCLFSPGEHARLLAGAGRVLARLAGGRRREGRVRRG